MTAFDTYFRSLVPEGPRALNELFNKDGMGLSVDPNRFANVPKVVITGDQDPRHTVDQKLARFLGTEFSTGDVGMPGHGHMMMLDNDNLKIARLEIQSRTS
jgi:pimeloyl-ACP methyl ester carboxylesterase